MMSRPLVFWNWFQNNLTKIISIESSLNSDLILHELHKVNKNLFFEVAIDNSADHEFIITAAGDSNYFKDVFELVNKAPKIEGWKFIALKQPMGFEFETQYEGIKINPKELWFRPLKNKAIPNALGLRIGIPEYPIDEKDIYLNAVHVLLETGLGEYTFSSKVLHVEIELLPDSPEKACYIKLIELPKYIKWKMDQ